MAGRPVATWLDLVVGVDFHLVAVPTPPTPLLLPHVHMALTGDPVGMAMSMAMAPLMSLITEGKLAASPGPVLVNGVPKLTTSDLARNLTLMPHVPVAPGPFAKPPSGEGVFHMGALTVTAGGASVVCMGAPAFTCSDPVPLPTSSVVVIPKGRPVLVGGPTGVNVQKAVSDFVTGRLVRTAFKGISVLARFLGRLTPVRRRTIVPRDLCTVTGHPVDAATGAVVTDAVDFTLPGPIPLVFERSYSSAWAGRQTDLGWGWTHSLDRAIWLEPDGVVCRLGDGREIVFETPDFRRHVIPSGFEVEDALTGYTLRATDREGWQLVAPEGLIETYERDHAEPAASDPNLWRIAEVRTRDGEHAIRFQRERGRLLGVTDSAGRMVRFDHDEGGRLTWIRLPDPDQPGELRLHVEFVYSPGGLLVEARDALGNATRYRYAGRLMVEEQRRNGVHFFWGYDGMSSAARCVRTWGHGAEGGGGVAAIFNQKLFYDPRNRKTWRLDSDGNQTEFRHDEAGVVTEIRDALGGVTRREYRNLRLVSETDPEGNTRTLRYDHRGRLTFTRAADRGYTITRYLEDMPEEVAYHRDERGGIWTHRHDRLGRLIGTAGPHGFSRRCEWEHGLLSVIEVAGRGRTEIEYDREKNASRIRLANGVVIEREHDRRGQLLSASVGAGDERGPRRTFEYDLLGRVVRQTDPDGRVQETTYDGEGNPVEVRDQLGARKFTYSGFDWLASSEEAGDRVELDYFAEGELREIRNEHGRPYRFGLDACRRVVEEAGFDVRSRTRYRRNKAGWVTEIETVSRKGEPIARTEVSRDRCGRVAGHKYADGTWDAFAYGPSGDLLEAANQTTTVTLERDQLGRVVRETQGEHWIQNSYHLATGLVGLESSLGARMVVMRDDSGAPSELALGPLHGNRLEIAIARDAFGREIERRLPGGVVERWVWDQADWPVRHGVATGQGTWLQTYTWALGDRLEALDDTRYGARRFKHDARGRIHSAESDDGSMQHRVADAVGNVFRTRERTDRRYLPGGMPRSAGTLQLDYDALGNMSRRWRPSEPHPNGHRFRWDGAGRLVEAIPESRGPSVVFAYDALGRRVSKTVGDVETHWVWAGEQLLHEIGTGPGPTVTWYHDAAETRPIARVTEEEHHAVVTDHLGTPTVLYDESGRPTSWNQLDLYGVPRDNAVGKEHEPSRQTDCPWRWPGQYADDETGLRYNRLRYYDPEVGLFISPDPIGLAGGLALYAYVDDPLIAADPLGLLEILRLPGPVRVDAYPKVAIGGTEHSPLHFHMKEAAHETRVLVDDYYKKGRLVGRGGSIYPGDGPLTKNMRRVLADHFAVLAARARSVFETGKCP